MRAAGAALCSQSLFRHSAVDRSSQLFQLDWLDEVVARIEAGGQRTGCGISCPRDHDGPARTNVVVRGAIETFEEAEVEDKDLLDLQSAQRAARVGVETQPAQATRSDLGQARVVIHHKHRATQVTRILDRAQVGEGFANVVEQALTLRRHAVNDRQLELCLQPRQRGSQPMQRRRQLRFG